MYDSKGDPYGGKISYCVLHCARLAAGTLWISQGLGTDHTWPAMDDQRVTAAALATAHN